jgi:hypothetical protein
MVEDLKISKTEAFLIFQINRKVNENKGISRASDWAIINQNKINIKINRMLIMQGAAFIA